MKRINLLLLIVVLSCSSCAAGAATAGYAIKAQSADNLASPARMRLVEEIKAWANDTFQKKN